MPPNYEFLCEVLAEAASGKRFRDWNATCVLINDAMLKWYPHQINDSPMTIPPDDLNVLFAQGFAVVYYAGGMAENVHTNGYLALPPLCIKDWDADQCIDASMFYDDEWKALVQPVREYSSVPNKYGPKRKTAEELQPEVDAILLKNIDAKYDEFLKAYNGGSFRFNLMPPLFNPELAAKEIRRLWPYKFEVWGKMRVARPTTS